MLLWKWPVSLCCHQLQQNNTHTHTMEIMNIWSYFLLLYHLKEITGRNNGVTMEEYSSSIKQGMCCYNFHYQGCALLAKSWMLPISISDWCITIRTVVLARKLQALSLRGKTQQEAILAASPWFTSWCHGCRKGQRCRPSRNKDHTCPAAAALPLTNK